MELVLAKGVNAHIQNTKKFKTVLIEYKFRSLYEPDEATARTLLKNMMVTNTQKYPSQKMMDHQMSWLYGASLSSNSQRYGNHHVVTLRLRVVNDKFIGGDETLLEEAFSFLREIIFHPNVSDNAFHSETFHREKKNLKNYFDSIEENKSGYSLFRLNQLLFKGTNQVYLGIGDVQYLDAITPESLYNTYLKMLQEDSIDIFVSGDVEEERIQQILEQSKFSNRESVTADIFVTSDLVNPVVKKEESSDVTQGNLLFGFSSPAYFSNKHYYAAMIFDGIFGGFPHSKLFQNVREKESLAYSASSSIDNIRGKMIVRTGIDFSKRNQVEKIVMEQLKDMQLGNFSEELISQTKEMLINQYKQNDDHQGKALSKIYTNELLAGYNISDEEWLRSLMDVTKENIIEVAKQMKLEAIFFLKGEEENHA